MTNTTSQLHDTVEEFLHKSGIVYEVFSCDPELADTALFCAQYGFTESVSANSIIAAGKSDPIKYACCVILATTKLDMNRKVCKLLGVKKASFASGDQMMALTGMQIGGVTPFGLPEEIPIYVDAAVFENEEIVMGGGNRSTKVLLNPRELEKISQVQIVVDLAIPKVPASADFAT